MMKLPLFLAPFLGVALTTSVLAETAKPTPTFANVPYGPSPHEIMDIYVPPGTGPFPVVLWYGGIWKADKGIPDLNYFFPFHIAVIAVETRTLEDSMAATPRPVPPISFTMLSARRAVQFVRLHAAEYHLDPDRIATAGGSQGTQPALYVACAGDKADPTSSDPVEKTSSKVFCVGAWRSQTSLDPKVMQEWVPGVEYGVPSWGYSFADSLAKYDEIKPLIAQWSPDALVNKDTPPIFFQYDVSLTDHGALNETEYRVHSPGWGVGFQKLAQSRGMTGCYLKFPGHPSEKYNDMWDFLEQQLNPAGK